MENNDNKKIITIVSGVIAGAVLLVVLAVLVDFFVLKFTGYGPLFATQTKTGNASEKIYNGLFYKAYKCDVKKNPHKVVIKYSKTDYSCQQLNLAKNDYAIVDETKTCGTGLEEIARDDMFIYYLSCMKSNSVFLEYGDGTKISVKDALAKKKVTVDELMKKGLTVYQEVINQSKQ